MDRERFHHEADAGIGEPAGSEPADGEEVAPMPTIEDLRAMAAELDEIDAILRKLDTEPSDEPAAGEHGLDRTPSPDRHRPH